MNQDAYHAVHQPGYGWVVVNQDGAVIERVGTNYEVAADKAAALSEGRRIREQRREAGDPG